MSDRVQSLEKAVGELSPVELKEFASWFREFDNALWDREMEEDANAGRLDFLIHEAKAARENGELRDL